MGLKYLMKEAKYYKKVDGSLKRVGLKYLFAKTAMKHFVNGALYSKMYDKKIESLAKNLKPTILSVENTNYCNATCVMCPHPKMERPKGVMSQKDFEHIVTEATKYEDFKFITITGFGEPFFDREIDKKLEFVNKLGKGKVIIFTNASLLTEDMTDKILKHDLFKINFSINGLKENYKKIMGLNYDNTVKNIEYFLKKKKELGKEYPLVNVSLMVLDENEKDIKEFTEHWQDKVDSVMSYLPSNWAGGVSDEIVRNPFKITKRWPCMTLWRFVTVDVHGNIVKCHRDYESKVKIGNLLKESYPEIQLRVNKLKEMHLRHDYSAPICRVCDNSTESTLDWWE